MLDFFRIEFQKLKLLVEDRSGQKCDHDRADAEAAAQQIADRYRNGLVDQLHHTDRKIEPLRQYDHQAVARPRAEPLPHIQPYPEIQDDHSEKQKGESRHKAVARIDQPRPAEQVDIQTDQQHIEDRADADARAQRILDADQQCGDQDHRLPDRNTHRIGEPARQNIPRAVAQICAQNKGHAQRTEHIAHIQIKNFLQIIFDGSVFHKNSLK